MDMQPWQQRVIEEHDDLQKKTDKLADFFCSDAADSLDDKVLGLMFKQRHAMIEYLSVLKQRIDLFERLS